MQRKNRYLNFLAKFTRKVDNAICDNFFCYLIWKLSNFLNEKYLKKIIKKKKIISDFEYFNSVESNLFILILTMNDNKELQNSWLSIFKLQSKTPKHLAFLEDRVLINYKGVQRYGTHIKEVKDGYILYPILGIFNGIRLTNFDIHALNKRRKRIGLNSIEDYLQELYKSLKVFVKI
jgi:hypothetical protein